ncbi:2877_t:CDS:1, partial [Gigaspora rosea]
LKARRQILNLLQNQYHEEQTEVHQIDQVWDIIVNSIKEAANTCLPKKILQYSTINKQEQKKEKSPKRTKPLFKL